jgi:hypothetical protein
MRHAEIEGMTVTGGCQRHSPSNHSIKAAFCINRLSRPANYSWKVQIPFPGRHPIGGASAHPIRQFKNRAGRSFRWNDLTSLRSQYS